MRYYLLTLGCAKNTADSDGMCALLAQNDWTRVEQPDDADVLIVNTCGFLQAARRESLDALRALGEHKRAEQSLVAVGCLISRYGDTIRREVPQVDIVLDAGQWLALPRVLDHLHRAQTYTDLPTERSIVARLPRQAQGPSAYLKIADGCDRPCTFCIIPAIKGAQRSKHPDDVIAEARDLVAHGAREIVLVAQDTTAYGWDFGERDALATLIERLCREVEGLTWLRLMYTFPGHITPRLIETLARYPQVVHYIDVPLQHAHPDTLVRMKRPNIVVTRKMLDDLRAAIPDLAIRTTFIVGFPGETEEEFRALLEFLEEQQFDRVGIFEFSREEGTPAATMPHQVSGKTKKYRRERAMALQQKISLAKNRAFIGKELDVLIEGTGDGISIARSYRDAPEVDGVVIIQRELPIGSFVRVQITQAMEYDLVGEVSSFRLQVQGST
ncbi:MAG: 30S ribosomal protein S12 methylthiotransferase RimO [Anaerolineae bacterium]|nr:30S ribosomal protein S12 methylthiotransferase RimO [Anaerolineae bacterium]